MRDVSGLWRECRYFARHAVVETGADRNQEIAVLDGVVGECRAVHPQHVKRQRMSRIERTETMQRRRNGDVVRLREPAQIAGRIALDYTSTDIQQRPFAVPEHVKEG